jgi:hypothetical protein
MDSFLPGKSLWITLSPLEFSPIILSPISSTMEKRVSIEKVCPARKLGHLPVE